MAGMSRFRRSRPVQGKQGTLLASAVLVSQSQLRTVPTQRAWQQQAWEYYDIVGELRFASQWISNALSRCSLHVGIMSDDSRSQPVDVDQYPSGDVRANIPLDELFGGTTGHAEMLARLATHLTVAGESYIIGYDVQPDPNNPNNPDVGQRRWLVCSSDEIKPNSVGVLKVRLPESDKLMPLNLATSTVIRLWRPHPRRAWEADSPVRASLPVLKELCELSAHISATIESRLAGAGLLLLPEGAVLPSASSDAGGDQLHEDPAMATLIEAMVTPIGNRDSASAVVPIIVRLPSGPENAKPQYLTFSTPLDAKIQELREASIRRFATIVDIPAEVLTGTADTNRWNAWKISEDAIKIHLEPLLGLICDALTTQYLWPALRALNVANVEQHVIWYDASELILRPNRGPESQNLYEHGLLKGDVVLRANGFSDEDSPDPEEAKRVLLKQLATAGINPYIAAPYLNALGIKIDLPAVPIPLRPAQIDDVTDGIAPAGTRLPGRPPNPVVLPTRNEPLPGNPDTVDRTAASATPHGLSADSCMEFALVEMAAMRALELVGKRLLNNSNRQFKGTLRRVDPWMIHAYIPIPPDDLNEVLDGAYTLLEYCLPEQPEIREVVDIYVRERLLTQQPHDRDALVTMLATAGCLLPGGGARAIA